MARVFPIGLALGIAGGAILILDCHLPRLYSVRNESHVQSRVVFRLLLFCFNAN
jgi:hypothetical protein